MNSNNWYYLFQIQGKKYFGSTQTPRKTLAAKVEAKVREDAISRLVLGEVKPITLEKALERYKHSKERTPNYKNAPRPVVAASGVEFLLQTL